MKVFVRLLKLARPSYWRFILVTVISLTVILANVSLLSTAGWFIAAMAAAGIAGVTINYFTPAAAIRAFAILRTIGRYFERLLSHDATLRLLSNIRVWAYEKVEPLAPALTGIYRSGDILNRLIADIDILDNAYLQILTPASVALFSGIGMLAFAMFISPPAGWIDLGLLLTVGVLLPWLAVRIGRDPSGRTRVCLAELKSDVLETLAGLPELESFQAIDAYEEHISSLNLNLSSFQDRSLSIESGMLSINVVALGLSIIAICLLLGTAAARDHIPPLSLPLMIFFVLSSIEAVQGLPNALRSYGDTHSAALRVFELTDKPLTVIEPLCPVTQTTDYQLDFHNVSLQYHPERPWALNNVTFNIAEGASVAFVGPSGAGKSSIAELFLRFRDPQLGEVRLGGHALTSYELESIWKKFSYAPQAVRLFSTSIRENLRLANRQADDQQLWEALSVVDLADEVRTLDHGLDSFVGAGGLMLSAGQARRLMLARAWLKDAHILLLDEPTENLDPARESKILRTLTEARGRRSLILITHRLAELDHMDNIVVMNQGRVAEQGTHQDLMKMGGAYRRMLDYLNH